MKEKKDVSSGFPGWRESLCGVYACLCVCSRPCSHTPGSFTLTATGNLTEGGRCLNIHQPSSKCSVWARCDGPEAGTELPKQLFIFPNVFIFSSSTPSPLVSTYNRGLAVPAYPPLPPRCENRDGKQRREKWPLGFSEGFLTGLKMRKEMRTETVGRCRCEIFHRLTSVLLPSWYRVQHCQ